VLGGEVLLERVRELLGEKPGRQELQWMTRAENPDARREAAEALAASMADRRLQAWVRVTLGGERRVDAAQVLGYKDGSAITHLLKRLQIRAATDRRLRAQLASVQKAFTHKLSAFDSAEKGRGWRGQLLKVDSAEKPLGSLVRGGQIGLPASRSGHSGHL
jgi:hypothetical protein